MPLRSLTLTQRPSTPLTLCHPGRSPQAQKVAVVLSRFAGSRVNFPKPVRKD